VSAFATPASTTCGCSEPGGPAPWGWRFGGHHVSLNNLVVDTRVRAGDPCFIGANQAHSVWRDPEADFGLDALAAHRAEHHSRCSTRTRTTTG
jgi:hypothetical protein